MPAPAWCTEDLQVWGGHEVHDPTDVHNWDLSVDATCIVARYEPSGLGYEAELLCPGEAGTNDRFVIDLSSNVEVDRPIAPDMLVDFRLSGDASWLWYDGWFTMRSPTDGTLLLAGSMGPVAEWELAPLDVEIAGPLCPPTDSSCARWEYGALDVSYDGGPRQRVLHGRSAALSPEHTLYAYSAGWTSDPTSGTCDAFFGLLVSFEVVYTGS